MAKNLPKKPQVFFIFLLAGRHAFGGMIQTIGLALRGALQQNGKIRAAPAAHIQHIGVLRQRQMGHGPVRQALMPVVYAKQHHLPPEALRFSRVL